ncbi:MAG: HEAT repeat-containing PBS [Geobacteraceae bacterium]|nr:MAG: HEAT repeat-containing PBS [Geobacteraceae bacterium]
MTVSKNPMLKLAKTQDDSARTRGAALAEVYKAMKSIGFYPKGHPLRAENLHRSHNALVNVLNSAELPLVITRSGFSSQEGGAMVENNPMTLSMARELFIRRVKRVTFLGDLSLEDLQSFLFLMTIAPQRIAADGGMEKLMAEGGIKTIWANEIDLSVIWEKRQALETVAGTHPVSELEDPSFAEADDGPPSIAAVKEEGLSIEEMIAQMDAERDDNRYLQLARLLAAKAEKLKLKEQAAFAPLFPIADALAIHSADEARSAVQREFAVFTLEQVTDGKMIDVLLRQLENKEFRESERIYRIIRQLGEKAAHAVIQRLCIADGLFARKALATALVRIGLPAVLPVVATLQDDRWYVVRNMVAILGEIGCRDRLNDLKPFAYHSDQRVRKEAIRSIAKIGGKEAESVVIGLLADRDPVIVRQAIHSLGVMKSQSAVQSLITLATGQDILLRTFFLKKEALQAIGRIGDRRASPHLLSLLETRHWLAWNKWEELQIAAAAALGQLGDESALPVLRARGAQSGPLGAACNDAVDTIERLAKEIRE